MDKNIYSYMGICQAHFSRASRYYVRLNNNNVYDRVLFRQRIKLTLNQ